MRSSISFFLLALLILFGVACQENVPTTVLEKNSPDGGNPMTSDLAEKVKYGGYLVGIMGCSDCHTPLKMTEQGPAPDMDRFLSGHPSQVTLPSFDPAIGKDYVLFNMTNTAAIGPWGTSFSGNLTPDNTGIGTWTEAQFSRALREGKYKGLENARSLLPPMPWQSYQQLKDEDLSAIFAYLKTIKPVNNVVPPPVMPVVLTNN